MSTPSNSQKPSPAISSRPILENQDCQIVCAGRRSESMVVGRSEQNLADEKRHTPSLATPRVPPFNSGSHTHLSHELSNQIFESRRGKLSITVTASADLSHQTLKGRPGQISSADNGPQRLTEENQKVNLTRFPYFISTPLYNRSKEELESSM